MKILYLSRAVFPSEVSHTLSIIRMCQAFYDCGHDLILLGRAASKNIKQEDLINYYGLKGGFKAVLISFNIFLTNILAQKLRLPDLILAFKARILVNNFKPDVIYTRLTLIEMLLIPKDTPIIYETHSLGYLGGKGFGQKIFKWLLKHKNFKRIIVTTNILKDMMQKLLPDVDIKVARLSAEAPLEIAEENVDSFKKENLQGQVFKKHIGYTGYLDNVGLRGTDVICKAAELVPDAAFHIVGGEPALVDYWIEFAQRYNSAGNIFFYGHQKQSSIPLFLKCFDIVLAPLQYKPEPKAPTGAGMSPLKIPQYLGYGKAIVASDIPAHKEILTDNNDAVLVKDSDERAWAEAVKSLIADDGKRHLLEANAKQHYYEEFTPAIRVGKILEDI